MNPIFHRVFPMIRLLGFGQLHILLDEPVEEPKPVPKTVEELRKEKENLEKELEEVETEAVKTEKDLKKNADAVGKIRKSSRPTYGKKRKDMKELNNSITSPEHAGAGYSCPKCKKIFTADRSPKILRCGDSICGQCISSARGKTIKCLVCSKITKKISKRNYSLEEVLF